ncbi:flippase [Halostagnicola sp. A-GB9-2]|uniref:lipopolysaccharide biosynthesis protein n=1 Tax=Halostagnicola sp. A-GB9-2 TaxID=3048066 RepID=UPI0024C057A5|nr:flippase [Halostagnicola sp. A-GB9-2]MDJ1433107.1 flippase [Halostagnicola sp. A-GB9-2]
MSLRKKVVSGFSAELVAQLFGVIFSGLLLVILARLLTAEQYGLLYLSISIFSVIILITSFGFSRSAARYITDYEENDPGQIPYIIRASLLYCAVALLVVGFSFTVFQEQISHWLGEPDLQPLLLVGILYIIFYSFVEYCRRIFQGFKSIKKSATLHVVNTSFKFVFVVLLVVIGFDAVGALVGYVVGLVVTSLFGAVLLYRTVKAYESSAKVEPGLRRKLFEYSLPITLTSSGTVLIKRVDVILIGFFLNPVAVGYYTVSKQIIDFVVKPANSLGFSISPRYSEQVSKGNYSRAATLYQDALHSMVLLYAPAAIGLFLVADPAVTLIFGQEYHGAIPVVQMFSIYVLIQAISYVTGSGLDYLGKAKFRAILKGTIAVGNVVLNIILIPTIGITGAALATVLTYGFYVTGNVYLMHCELPLDWAKIAANTIKALLIASVMGAIVFALSAYITGYLSLIAVIGTGIAIWATLSIATGVVEPQEIRAHMGV